MDEKVWVEERSRLKKVMELLTRKLEDRTKAREKYKQSVTGIQKSMWEEVNPTPTDLDDLANIWQMQVDIETQGRKFKHAHAEVAKLERMLKSPYFGRIDFLEEGEIRPEKIYIGIAGLVEESTMEYYVYDWRAPICSMFYDYETGKAQYLCPAGVIRGDMTLKRQYRIFKGEIEYMFDCSLKIDDEVLQEILAGSADSKMKTIVTSIQREQNRIIRDEICKVLIVQGPAGSGKTSIALHRAAYLLYRHHDTLSAENLAVLSPNQIFSDYISDVLPQLGEENIYRTTFRRYAQKMLGSQYQLEDASRQMEFILCGQNRPEYAVRIEGIRFKATVGFLEVLKAYIQYLEEEGIVFCDLASEGKVYFTGAEMTELFRKDFSYLPLSKRMLKIRQRLLYLLEPVEKEKMEEAAQKLADTGEYADKNEIRAKSILLVREMFKPLKEKLEQMTNLDAVSLYGELLKNKALFERLLPGEEIQGFDAVARFTAESIKGGKIHYEDLAPILYLKGAIGELPDTSSIKHLIIDEMQDYTPIQLETIHQLFKASRITMLGDLAQSVNPCTPVTPLEQIARIFGADASWIMNLSKSYRSTREITRFCRALLSMEENSDYIDREGEKPLISGFNSIEEMTRHVVLDIQSLKSKGYGSIAVITRTAGSAGRLYGLIGKETGAKLVSGDDEKYEAGVVILPSYLSKGLEFDAVLALNPSEDAYWLEQEKRLIYTVMTRALHVLRIYYTGKMPEWLENKVE